MKPAVAVGIAAAALLLLRSEVNADSSGSVTAVVPIADQISVHATNIATAEGATISGPIATFTDSNTSRAATAFAATVAWGDGVTTGGSVSGASGHFSVAASHAYAEEGAYAITVAVHQTPNGSSAHANGHATIADAALFAAGWHVTSGKKVNAFVAAFIDLDPHGQVTDYTVRIDWGDGSHSAGTVTSIFGVFGVTGSHAYAHTGQFTVRSAISDVGGAHTSTTTTITVH
jgi:hypothetical protein